ncbi:MAG: DUF3892 domain-containing protein [Campylobacteraceae bacterium]|jgi:hypothetical protein|nr:DUF3892 domain-containing protein [Campylobacteraceae bacterium]
MKRFHVFLIILSLFFTPILLHANTLISGEQQSTLGATVISQLTGLPSQTSELIYAGMNIGAGATVGATAIKMGGNGEEITKVDLPNFYVNSQGQAIQSVGCRYISSDAPYLQDLISTGIISANTRGTYITFNKMGIEAADKLQ